jgi:NACHT domain
MIIEILRQVITYRKIFPSGYHHLTLGRITIMPANHATLGLDHGSFRVTRSQNGKRLSPGVPFYGFTENVCYCIALALLQTLNVFLFVAGAGKSVFWYVKLLIFPSQELIVLISSTIIEDIDSMRKAGLASLTFFYCDFRESQKKDLRGLLSSLLVQLCHQSNSYCDILFEFYSEHAEGSRPPSNEALVECLKDLLKRPGLAPVYLIVDALDECPNIPAARSPRAQVLQLIDDLIESQFPNLRICVTSRPEADIKDVLDPLNFRSVSLHDQSGQNSDIENYITSVIKTHPTSRRWKAEHQQLVIDVLKSKADGMYGVNTGFLIVVAHFCGIGSDG